MHEIGDKMAAMRSALLIEDDEQLAFILRFILEREGFDVRLASDGRTAQAVIDSAEAPPAVVMLKLMLPHVDGFQLIRSIRTNEAWRDVPILVLTSRVQNNDVSRALACGANEYIMKPFDSDELRAHLTRLTQTPA